MSRIGVRRAAAYDSGGCAGQRGTLWAGEGFTKPPHRLGRRTVMASTGFDARCGRACAPPVFPRAWMWITLHSRVRGGACRRRGGVGTVVDATRASRAPQRAPRKRAHRLLITTESQMFAVGGLSAHELVPAGRQLPIRAGLSRAVR